MNSNQPFYWGVASSAFQTEGACTKDGKGLSIWDEFTRKRGRIKNNDRADNATEFYERFKQDLEFVNALGIENFRFSISWPRVIPNGSGPINYKGLDFYDRLTDACLEKEITPWVTLYHWDLPLALEEKGGWTNRSIINWFGEYVEVVVKRLGDRVKHWMSLNEPLAFTGAGYFLGVHAPGKRGTTNFLPAVHHAALAQAIGIKLIRFNCPNAYAGSTFSCSPVNPLTPNDKDIKAAKRVDAILNRLFIDPLIGRGYPLQELPFLNRLEKYILPNDEQRLQTKVDFIGLQNYTREVVAHSWYTPYVQAKIISPAKRGVPVTSMNWEIYPQALSESIRRYSNYPEIPSIIVTENGAAFPDVMTDDRVNDDSRLEFIKNNIRELTITRNEGCKVNGYFVWSLTDNFEWAEGFQPRFGLVHVDYNSQVRTIKRSGHWYGEHCRRNSMHANQIPANS